MLLINKANKDNGINFQFDPLRLPAIQNKAFLISLSFGAKYIIRLVNPEKNEDIATPIKTNLVLEKFLFPVHKNTNKVTKVPNKKANIGIEKKICEKNKVAKTAPVLAPAEIPRIYGLARGFLVRHCIKIPTSESEAPDKIALIILGALKFQTMISILFFQVFSKTAFFVILLIIIFQTSIDSKFTEPRVILKVATMTIKISKKIEKIL